MKIPAHPFAAASLLAIVFAAFGCADKSPPANSSTGAGAGTSAAAGSGTASAAVSGKDREFVEKAAKSGQEEVSVSEAALPGLTGAEARAFASMMVNDHTGANRELEQLASRKGVPLPAAATASATGAAAARPVGDAAYLDKMVGDHEQAVALFTDASKNAADPEIRAFAAKTLPTLQTHLDRAKTARKAVK